MPTDPFTCLPDLYSQLPADGETCCVNAPVAACAAVCAAISRQLTPQRESAGYLRSCYAGIHENARCGERGSWPTAFKQLNCAVLGNPLHQVGQGGRKRFQRGWLKSRMRSSTWPGSSQECASSISRVEPAARACVPHTVSDQVAVSLPPTSPAPCWNICAKMLGAPV
jgi:hypothetical protein